jgi:hypothetical protein
MVTIVPLADQQCVYLLLESVIMCFSLFVQLRFCRSESSLPGRQWESCRAFPQMLLQSRLQLSGPTRRRGKHQASVLCISCKILIKLSPNPKVNIFLLSFHFTARSRIHYLNNIVRDSNVCDGNRKVLIFEKLFLNNNN